MGWFRFTTRRLMALILLLAVALGPGVPAVAAWREAPGHVHAWVGAWGGVTSIEFASLRPPPFGVRYWHRLLGRRWGEQPECGMGRGRLAEACYYDHRGVVRGGGIIPTLLNPTPTMLAILEQARRPIRRRPAFEPVSSPLIFPRLADATPVEFKPPDSGQASQAGGLDPDGGPDPGRGIAGQEDAGEAGRRSALGHGLAGPG